MTVFAPAPSAEAFVPDVPAAPAVPPAMTEAGSESVCGTGAVEVSVGNALTWVLSWMRCCALVALTDCPAHARRNCSERDVPGLTNASVQAAAVGVTPPTETEYCMDMMRLLSGENGYYGLS